MLLLGRPLTIMALSLAVSLPLLACNGVARSAAPAPTRGSDQRSAIASFYPLQEVLEQVGGSRIAVSNLVPAGAEPHDLELSPRELERLRTASLLVYIGGGFQPGLERALQAAEAPSLTVLDVAQGLPLLEGSGENDAEEAPVARGRTDARSGQRDPHIWLDPVLMKDVVGKVRDALARIDPGGRDVFETNAQSYAAQLDALDVELRVGLERCARREIITSHAAFQYLARRYGLEQVSISGLSPEAEPSPQQLAAAARIAREHGARVIYFESLVDPRVATTLAREVGARTLLLNPIEGLTPEEQAQGKRYGDLMRENLANLRAGLECA